MISAEDRVIRIVMGFAVRQVGGPDDIADAQPANEESQPAKTTARTDSRLSGEIISAVGKPQAKSAAKKTRAKPRAAASGEKNVAGGETDKPDVKTQATSKPAAGEKLQLNVDERATDSQVTIKREAPAKRGQKPAFKPVWVDPAQEKTAQL